MAWLKSLGSLFKPRPGGDGTGFYYWVKCRRCGEVLRVRADRRFDLEQDFGQDGDVVAGYVLHKEVLGQRCPQLIQLEVRFDRSYREVARSAEGGEFVPAPEG